MQKSDGNKAEAIPIEQTPEILKKYRAVKDEQVCIKNQPDFARQDGYSVKRECKSLSSRFPCVPINPDRANVVTVLKQMCRKRMAERVRTGVFWNPCFL